MRARKLLNMNDSQKKNVREWGSEEGWGTRE